MRGFKFLAYIMFVTGILFFYSCNKTHTQLHTVNIHSISDLQNYFQYSPEKDIMIAGHRGGMLEGYPENSIAACEKTLSMMHAYFEIDARLTKDSVIVLMHDVTIDRTTTGKGNVSDYTYDELQQFDLKDRQGNVTPYKIPTLDEMLEWGKGKTVFNIDNKDVPWQVMSDNLNGKWKEYYNIMLYVRSSKECRFYFERNKNTGFFFEISNMDLYREFDALEVPWKRIVAYVGNTMDPAKQELYNLIHSHGVMCQIAIAPAADKVEPYDAKFEAYQKEIDRNPDIIETDYPSNFVDLPLTRVQK
jgi:glycerophosphoryl diester phosphodiesterase